MKYKKIKNEAYNLHIINTDKFKKTLIRINFKNKNIKENIVKRRLVPAILSESNNLYKTKRLLSIKTEELYSLVGGTDVTNSGESIITSFNANILNEKYAPGLFEDAFAFVTNIIFNPKVVDGKFDDKAFKYSCECLKEEIDVYNESPGAYASSKMLEKLAPNTPLSYPPYGTKEEINNTKNKDVYDSYVDMINNDYVDIFLIGNIPSNAEAIVKKYFKLKGKRNNTKHYIYHDKFTDKYKEYSDTKDYNQSTLLIGYKADNLTDFERDYVMPIYTYILGGGGGSRLFENVREKHSLCYSISCSFKPISNIMVISSGINASAYKKALKLIKEEVAKMNKGEFDKSDIDKAKITYLSAYEEVTDSILSTLGNYVSREYFGTDLINTRKRKIKKVTKKDILNVIPKIHPEVVYLLEGGKENEKKNI
jgi:predicted Zn-dependent peptidase